MSDSAERLKLLAAAKAGDDRARGEVVRLYVNLVRKLSFPYKTRGFDPEDLTQEGLIGLIKAMDSFDPGKGITFSTYCGCCVKNEVLKAITRTGDGDHSHDGVTAFFRARKAGRALEAAGIEPTPDAIAEKLGVRLSAVTALLPLVELTDDMGGASDLEGELAEEEERRQQLRMISEATAHLSPVAQEVIRRRFLLVDGSHDSLEEIGNSMGVCRERVRQIEEKSIDKIKSRVQRSLWD